MSSKIVLISLTIPFLIFVIQGFVCYISTFNLLIESGRSIRRVNIILKKTKIGEGVTIKENEILRNIELVKTNVSKIGSIKDDSDKHFLHALIIFMIISSFDYYEMFDFNTPEVVFIIIGILFAIFLIVAPLNRLITKMAESSMKKTKEITEGKIDEMGFC